MLSVPAEGQSFMFLSAFLLTICRHCSNKDLAARVYAPCAGASVTFKGSNFATLYQYKYIGYVLPVSADCLHTRVYSVAYATAWLICKGSYRLGLHTRKYMYWDYPCVVYMQMYIATFTSAI